MLAQILFVLLPTVAYPFDTQTLQRPDVEGCASQIFELSGFGRRQYERAAFLILRDDGRFDCQVWPASFQWRSERWSGKIPEGTAAVMHTHPRHEPRPSVNDIATAQRLDVPVIVVTEQGLSMVRNDAEGRIALTLPDEGTRDRQTHTRPAGAVPYQRP